MRDFYKLIAFVLSKRESFIYLFILNYFNQLLSSRGIAVLLDDKCIAKARAMSCVIQLVQHPTGLCIWRPHTNSM